MANPSEHFLSHFRFPVPRYAWYLVTGAAVLGTVNTLRALRTSALELNKTRAVPSPRETVLPGLSQNEIQDLPYPPDALPGIRDVDSPYGRTRVYEWGPTNGPRVLLIHGISTPSIALGALAHRLAEKGCRVMLFDLFSRGYSSGPDPQTANYDAALYTTQILLCISSSPIPWQQFTLVGYSLGGAIASNFTSYFPHLVSGLVLIAPGGLIRTKHITWKSTFMYSTSGLVPKWLIERIVARRLWTGPETARSIEPEPDKEAREKEKALSDDNVYRSSHHALVPGKPNSTVGKVVDWQIAHHKGFVPSFISSIQHAPIHTQHHRWRLIGERMKTGEGALRQVHLVLGEDDPIIVAEEVEADVKEVLGDEYTRVHIMKQVGHEVAIERANDIADIVGATLGL